MHVSLPSAVTTLQTRPEEDQIEAPFPWPGGKTLAAPLIWRALGNVVHYVEPFAGSLAVLLHRPHQPQEETVNDADGLLVNAWRSIQRSPVETAHHATNPPTEADQHARHLALLHWRENQGLERLMADPYWHDPLMGGWWLWGQSIWLGTGWCRGDGAWTDIDGVLTRQPPGPDRRPGIARQKPVMHRKGVQRTGLQDPGQLEEYMTLLSQRLAHVRVLNGDWTRSVTPAILQPLSISIRGTCGIFLDPPYADTAGRTDNLYAVDSLTVAHDVREWALTVGDNPSYRIALAGYTGEHDTLTDAGWTETEWDTTGGRPGLGSQRTRERLWLSPYCLDPTLPQGTLW